MDYHDIKTEVDKRATILQFMRWARAQRYLFCSQPAPKTDPVWVPLNQSDEMLADRFLEILDRKQVEDEAGEPELFVEFK